MGMTTISLKLPEGLLVRLDSESRARRTTKSFLVRECLERQLPSTQPPEDLPELPPGESCYDQALPILKRAWTRTKLYRLRWQIEFRFKHHPLLAATARARSDWPSDSASSSGNRCSSWPQPHFSRKQMQKNFKKPLRAFFFRIRSAPLFFET